MGVKVWLAAAAACAGAVALACKSSTETSCGSGTPPSLTGTYALQSFQLGATTPLTPPSETGTLRLHATTYGASLAGLLAQDDSGTYVITGASCISQNSVVGNQQFVGTFTLVGTTLTLLGSVGGQAATVVWTKTS
ncbi:MAG TPA: hypothetical protein VEH83_08525 [Gemmatimonadales bacterium]|nr:hypothetical protein [Gemmatimonadales bacterium]